MSFCCIIYLNYSRCKLFQWSYQRYSAPLKFPLKPLAKTRHVVHSCMGTISEWHDVDSYSVKNNAMLLYTSVLALPPKGSLAEEEVASI